MVRPRARSAYLLYRELRRKSFELNLRAQIGPRQGGAADSLTGGQRFQRWRRSDTRRPQGAVCRKAIMNVFAGIWPSTSID
jgi:hypothetical protein